MNTAKLRLARAQERAAAKRIALPDVKLVLRAIEPMRSICPSCKEKKPQEDWIYLPNEGQREAYCWDCLHKSDHAKCIGVKRCCDESTAYVQECIAQIVPEFWVVKQPERWTKSDAKDVVLTRMLKEAIRRYTPCIGAFSRRWHYNGQDYIDCHKPCRGDNAKTYCTRVGFLCADCLNTSAYAYETARTQVDLKIKLRLICEGSRFLAIMAGLDDMVPGLQGTWGLSWIDWARSTVETTDECLTWPMVPDLEQDKERLGKLNRA